MRSSYSQSSGPLVIYLSPPGKRLLSFLFRFYVGPVAAFGSIQSDLLPYLLLPFFLFSPSLKSVEAREEQNTV